MSRSYLPSLMDTALDRTVVGGYTRLGYWVRSRSWPDNDPRPGSMADKTALVTGSNSGLGKTTTARLAQLGATVHMLVRDEQRGHTAREQILRDVPDADLRVTRLDVSDLSDLRAVGEQLAERLERVDVLVHNAGVMPESRRESKDGHELALATHVLGPLALTEKLRPALANANGRVILVSSGGMYTQSLPVDDPEYTRGEYKGATAYARTKRMQVAFTALMQDRWGDGGVTVHTMHPGWADTPGIATSLPLFRKLTRPLLRDTERGADTIVWLAATEPTPPGGRFWHDRAVRPTHYLRSTRESEADVDKVWNYCLTAAGLPR
jgi:dehydrogenase/reductase SDR family member 12